jgi:copper(I)-binding protein
MIMAQGICMQLNKLMTVMVVSSALALSGCSAMGTAIKKRNLEVKTQMSETIWLEPSNNKTVYLQIKNTSDKDMSGLQAKIASAVTSKGYQVVSNGYGGLLDPGERAQGR